MEFIKNNKTKFVIGAGALLAVLLVALMWVFRAKDPERGIVMWSYTSPLQFWGAAIAGMFALIGATVYYLTVRKKAEQKYKEQEAANREEQGRYYRSSSYGGGYKTFPLTTSQFWMAAVVASIVVWACAAMLLMIHKGDNSREDLLKSAHVTRVSHFNKVTDLRRVPRVVANRTADNRFNRPNYTLSDGHLIKNASGEWVWSYIETPRRTWMRNTGGVVQVSAEHQTAPVVQYPKPGTPEYSSFKFKVGPNMELTDGASWVFHLDVDYYSDPQEWIGAIGSNGKPFIMSPVISYAGGAITHPVWAGVVVIHPDGSMKLFSPAQAQQQPDLVRTGHLFPENLARQIAESYRYLHGGGNQQGGILGLGRGDHKDQFDVFDDGSNPQPYLLQGADGNAYWTTMLRPFSTGHSLGAIMYTNAVTGKTTVWWAPAGSSLIGNDRAIDVAESLPINGVNYGENGHFGAVEPHPVFDDKGNLQYVVSIVPQSNANVSKAVVVDAATAQPVALFDYDNDANAESALASFVKMGVLPESARLHKGTQTAQDTAGSTTSAPATTTGGNTTSGSSSSPAIGLQLTPAQVSTLLAACRKDAACKAQVLK